MQAIWVCSSELLITYANAPAGTLMSCPENQLTGKSFLYLLHCDERIRVQGKLLNLPFSGKFEDLLRIGSDEYGWNTRLMCINRASDGPFIITTPNVTDSDAAGREQLRIFQQLIDASDNIVYAFDLEGRCLVSNALLAQKAGRSIEAMRGTRRMDFLPDDTALTHEDNDRKIAALGTVSIIEETNVEAGELQIYLSTKFPLLDLLGNIFAVGGISSNVTAQRMAEKALKDSERQFESLAMISPVGIFRTDIDGRCLYVNKLWSDFSGIRTEDALGKFWGEALYEEDVQRVRQHWDHSLVSGCTFSAEFRFQRQDGLITWLYSNGEAILDNSNQVSGYICTLTDITDIRRTQDLLVSARGQIEKFAKKNLDILEEERKHLSRELHDEIGQMLTALKLGLGQIRRKSVSEGVCGFVDRSISIVDEAIIVLRNIARRLRPPQLDDLGLVASLRWYIDNLVRQTSQSIGFYESVGNERFTVDLELVIFRVTQEAISNALRHSRGSQIIVSLSQSENFLELSISDNGIGFDVQALGVPGLSGALNSLGLLGMRERTCSVGGEFKISSEENQGVVVTCRFPVVSDT